jgi:predicted RNA-binding protein YlxR (DUF448 family)
MDSPEQMPIPIAPALAAAIGGSPAAPEAADEEVMTGPLRRCILSREVLPKEALVRFVVGPADELVPDVNGQLPGRGIWIKADRKSVATAVAKHLFAKAAKKRVVVAGDLPDKVEALLVRRALDQLGLARRAGAAVTGAGKVRTWLESGQAGLLLGAVDSGEDGRRKLRNLAGDTPVIEVFASAELSGALGGNYVVHVAVAHGAFTDRIRHEAARVAGFRRNK